ncbi:MAG: Do family serine endopeptidase [Rhizobiales bacterium]|nr:Do family serine endopeptidase [Hyphomicrobiales bacterium]
MKLRRILVRGTAAAAIVAGIVGAGTIATFEPIRPALAQDSGRITPFVGAPASFADLVEQVQGAVVSVDVTSGGKTPKQSERGGGRGAPSIPGLPEDHPFNEFFKRFGEGNQPDGPFPPRRTASQGSGFIISADGYVVTNNHVIDGADKIKVSIDARQQYDARLIGADPRTDLALLKIDAERTFNFVEFSTQDVRVGDWVIAVGNPFGLGGTVTAGIVSAKSRDIGSGPYDYIQVDAAVNRGNSGGPTFDMTGRVIGVNTAIYSPSGGNVGIAFAVPASLAAQVIQELKDNGSIRRGWLGVHIQSLNEDLAASLGMDEPKGALVSKITRNGPASKSDIRIGDAIVAVNGDPIADSRDLARKVAEMRPGTVVDVTVYRDGREEKVAIELGTFPGNQELASLEEDDGSAGPTAGATREIEDLGLALARLPEGSDGEPGVLVSKVSPDSTAAEKGLQVGDIILEVAGTAVAEPADVVEGVQEAGKRGRRAVLLRIKSGNRERFVALPLGKS